MSTAPTHSAELGIRIQQARQAAGLTQRGLAEAAGLSMFTLDGIESGQICPNRHLHAIARVTQRQPQWFLRGIDSRPAIASIAPAAGDTAADVPRTLVLASIVLLVTIRFFTEVIPVLPRAANFVDIPIFVVLAAAAALMPTIVNSRSAYLRLGFPATLFLVLAIGSALVNATRTAPAPVLVFIYGFLAPIVVYASVYKLWPTGNARALSRLLVALGLVQLAVTAVISLPRFLASGNNPDLISGTFGTNAYQLVFFLLLVATLLAGIFTLEPRRAVARFAPGLLFAIFGVILLAQYRALLASTVIAIAVVALILRRRVRGLIIAGAIVVAFVGAFIYVASSFPNLKLDRTATTLTDNPLSYARERGKVAGILRDLYTDKPFAAVTGTGPGTFSSRAWQTFANADSKSLSNVQGGYAQALTGGVYKTDVSSKYIRTQLREGPVVEGSYAVSSPYSSYLSLPSEVGLFGLVLIVGIYLTALSQVARITLSLVRKAEPTDSLPALSLATTIAFLTLLQMGFLENWLEVTRVTFIAWALLAVVMKEAGVAPQLRRHNQA